MTAPRRAGSDPAAGARPSRTTERGGGSAAPARSALSRAEEVLREFHEEDVVGHGYDLKLLYRLWTWVKPYRGLLAVALAGTLVTALAALARPLVLRWVLDEGVLRRELGVLMRGGALLAGVMLLEQALLFAQVYTLQVAGARGIADLRRGVFRFLHEQRLSFFDQQPVGRLVTRVTNDTDVMLELFASGVIGAAGDLLRLAGIVSLMLALEPRLAAITFAGAPPVALLVVVLRRRYRDAYRVIRSKTARMNATINEQVSGIAVVQAFRRERSAQREFDEINASYRDANVCAIKYEAMQDAAIELVAAVCLASMLMYVGFSPVSFGTLVAFNVYVLQFFEPISMLSQRYTLLQSAMAGAERVFKLLDLSGERDAPPVLAERSLIEASRPRGDEPALLELSRVSFGYRPGSLALREVSLRVRQGERIALVGPTGSGKSTVASLLLRLYEVDPGRGCVRIGGQDVRALPRHELRRRFAVVPQDVFLFPGTLASNVAFSDAPDLDRVRRVFGRIGALDVFERRDGGLNARVDERGANYSAGERQLIAFARALYRDAEILILDEATANVDSDTESRLERAVSELLSGRTSIVIAHRLSTIRAADRILVLRAGRIVEQGSHDELLSAGGLYSRLYSLQIAAEPPASGPSPTAGERDPRA